MLLSAFVFECPPLDVSYKRPAPRLGVYSVCAASLVSGGPDFKLTGEDLISINQARAGHATRIARGDVFPL